MTKVNFVSNNLSITPLVPDPSPHRAISDSDCSSHSLGPTTPCFNLVPTTHGILVGLPNGATMQSNHTALIVSPVPSTISPTLLIAPSPRVLASPALEL